MPSAYFDNNGTTQMLPQVLEAMRPFLGESFGNPSSVYARGREARAAVEAARESVAHLLGCAAREVVFTSGGTEADNAAIVGMVAAGDHVITSTIEHDAVLNCCAYLKRMGVAITAVPVNRQGRVDPDGVRAALRPETRLISVMLANNETGVLQPLEEIGRIAADADVWFHTDAVQAAGKIPISVDRIGCDLLAISGHKLHGPQGIGALYVRRNTPLRPIIHGGHQERGHRAGTENVPAIVGLGKAAELAAAGLADGTLDRIRTWRDRFEAQVLERVESTEVNGAGAPRVPNTSNIFFEYILGEALVVALDRHGIAASAGSACSAGSGEPSHVLAAMGLGATRARSSVRFSLGKLNSEADVEYLMSVLPGAVRDLREASPLYRRT